MDETTLRNQIKSLVPDIGDFSISADHFRTNYHFEISIELPLTKQICFVQHHIEQTNNYVVNLTYDYVVASKRIFYNRGILWSQYENQNPRFEPDIKNLTDEDWFGPIGETICQMTFKQNLFYPYNKEHKMQNIDFIPSHILENLLFQ